MNSNNPRATNFISTTKDENNAVRIIKQFRTMESPTLHYLLCKYNECNIIKTEPEFIQILFNDHHELVRQMIEWMLTPKLIIKRKNIKSNLDFFPFRSKEFMKDNIYFYEQLYLSARSEKLPISLWFSFLKNENYDSDTIQTALGYFAEVMIPFVKYQFSGSANLTQSIDLATQGEDAQTLSIMKILPQKLINQLIQFCYYEPIFQFLKTAVLVSIQDFGDFSISRSTMLKILETAQSLHIFSKFPTLTQQNNQQLTSKFDLLDNISLSLKQVIANIQPGVELQLRTQSFISIILQSKTIIYAINQITQSRLCNPPKTKVTSTNSMDLASSQQLHSPKMVSAKSSLSLSQGCLPSPKTNINLFQNQQQDLMQIMLRILTYSVQIFIRIPKQIPLPALQEQQDKKSLSKENRYENYKLLVYSYQQQMQYLLQNLQKMTKLVYNDQGPSLPSKPIPFSSGQKIKAISFMKFQFLKLIHNCLIMIQIKDNIENKLQKVRLSTQAKSMTSVKKTKTIQVPPFEVKIQKLHIIQIIQKYLNENRWNNIVHHVLQKICHSLVICSYDYLSKNIQKDKNKKLTESFLAFLIENFTQRDYIFLNTFKFTPQGNLHSLYNISKDLAYTLNSTNQLVILLNEFQPWKKFIMNDLKVYEEKTYPNSIKPDDDDDETNQKQIPGLKVDEADSIKKLIENISLTKKWPQKISKSKRNSRSFVNQRLSSDQGESMSKSGGYFVSKQQINYRRKQPLKKTLDDLLKKKVQYSIQYQNQKQIKTTDVQDISVRKELFNQSHVKIQQIKQNKFFSSAKSMDKKNSQLYGVFRNYAETQKIQNKNKHNN